MRETPQLKHIEQVSDGWIKKYILTYVLPDGSDYIYEAASRKGLEAYRAELARLEERSNTAIAAIDEGADDFGAAAVAAAEQAAGASGKRTADAVSIVPITSDGNLVLIREFRYPLNSWVVGLPAGLVEPGEDLAVAQQHCGMYAQLGGIIGKVPEEPLHYRAGKARLLRGAARQGFPCGQKGKAPHLTCVAVGGYALHVPFKHFDEQFKAAHLNGNVHFSSGY